WALLEWRETRKARWLLALAAAVGWGAITRPLSMLAFAIPVGVVVIHDVARLKLWRDFAGAFALGTLFLAILPLWSAQTTGNWRLTPQTLYTRDYLPYDKPGFGVDKTRPARLLTPPNEYTYIGFYPEHQRHTLGNLPRIAAERLATIARQEWPGFRLVLGAFALLGLTALSAEVAFALVCSLCLFAGYMMYGHWNEWTLYYFEATPILSVLTALGIWRAIEWLRPRFARDDNAFARRVAPFAVASVLVATLTTFHLVDARRKRQVAAQWDDNFRRVLEKTPFKSAVVFVHYRKEGPHHSIVANSPNLATEPFWIVNSLGPRNRELMRFAGDRVPLAFYEDTEMLKIEEGLVADSVSSGAQRH
ncbi:MAG TPA: hypothetical protein VIP11_04780, partial [Gemmatimonadaceae bacterium]